MKTKTPTAPAARINGSTCPHCHEAGRLEASLQIELEDLEIRDGKIVAFRPGRVATDHSNGIVIDHGNPGVYVTCANCDHDFDETEIEIPHQITLHWSFHPALPGGSA